MCVNCQTDWTIIWVSVILNLNLPTIIILSILVIVIVIAIISIVRKKHRCSCGCSGCPMSENCNNEKKLKENKRKTVNKSDTHK